MRAFLVLWMGFSLSASLRAEVAAKTDHTALRGSAVRQIERAVKSAKEEKEHRLSEEISNLEIRKLELELEAKKFERFGSGDRTLENIQRELSRVNEQVASTTKTLELTRKLDRNNCLGNLAVISRNDSIRDWDSGAVTGTRLNYYLVCYSVADTCEKGSYPKALVTRFGRDVKEESLLKNSDPREGKDCPCFCERR